jgi:hypothetical protein
MADARRLAHHLQHVHVAIGVERIARVVGGEADADAARAHLVHQRDAAPRGVRGVPGLRPVLEVEVAHRQADHVDPGLGHQVQRVDRPRLVLRRERAAMADDDAALEAGLDLQLRDVAQGLDAGVHRLVDVEIGIQPARGGLGEETPQPVAQVVHRVGDHAQNAALGLATRSAVWPKGPVIVRPLVAADQAHGLKVDPVGPVGLKLPEDGPGDVVLRRDGCRDACGSPACHGHRHSAARRPCAGAGLRRSSGGAVGADGGQRAHETAVGIGAARPDMALVEMGVHVDEGGKDHGAAHVDGDRLRVRDHGRPRWRCRCGSGRPPAPKGRRGWSRSQSVTPPCGIVRKSIRFPADGAFVPLPEEQVRQQLRPRR